MGRSTYTIRLAASGRVSVAALERLRRVLRAHHATARTWQVDHVIVTGTSASRDAENGDEIRAVVYEETAAAYRILSGEEEADVTFEGALAGWAPGARHEGHVTIVDVGGGSTELVQGELGGGATRRTSAVSLNIGTVRLTEQFYTRQPPSSREVDACRTWTASLMDAVLGDYARGVPIVGASGTAHVLLHLNRVHRSGGAVLTGKDLAYWERELHLRTREEVLALAPERMSGRADVFPAGVLVLCEAFRTLSASAFHVSDYGVRHGMALRYFRELEGG